MRLRSPRPRKSPASPIRPLNPLRDVPTPPVAVLPAVPTRIFDFLSHQLAHYPKPDALACKVDGEWRRYSTQEAADTVRALAAGLRAAGVGPGDRVANVTENNRPEWNFIDLAVLQLGAVHVPIYPTLTGEEFAFILHDAGAKLVFVSSQALREKIAAVAERLPALENIISYDPPCAGGGRAAADALCWNDLRVLGETLLREKPSTGSALDAAAAAVQPGDLATLIYTSGTTGQPKGVMLSHENLVSNCLAIVPLIGGGPDDRAISFLPLCHIFERTLTNAYLYSGMSIYYAESMEKVGENLREVRPDFFAIVPRVLEKMFERIVAKGNELTGRRRQLFFWALELAERIDPEAPVSLSVADKLRLAAADRLIFSQWRAAFGGKVNGMVCGSAALNPRLARIFWNAGLRVFEGYGPTEAAPVITSNHREHGEHHIGTVGTVISGGEIQLAPDGEILYRGPNVMLGYYHRPDLTAEVLDAEGFLHTGDVGEFVDGGNGVKFLRITDRKKEIFKTSGGKYIAPQPVENKLKESPFIAQAMVVGEYRKFPGALVVPNFAAMRDRLQATEGGHGPLPASNSELVKLLAARMLIGAEVARINEGFAQYAKIKNFALLGEEWTTANGELTPTQKLKRREIVKKYATEIETLYEPGDRR